MWHKSVMYIYSVPGVSAKQQTNVGDEDGEGRAAHIAVAVADAAQIAAVGACHG